MDLYDLGLDSNAVGVAILITFVVGIFLIVDPLNTGMSNLGAARYIAVLFSLPVNYFLAERLINK